MKKLLRVLLSLAVCLSLVIPASADGYGDRSFAIDGGDLTVSFDAASVAKERLQITQVDTGVLADVSDFTFDHNSFIDEVLALVTKYM